MINRIIGKRMRMLRKSLNLTQKQFAHYISGQVDQAYIGKIERGHQYPSIKMLEKIAKSYGVSINYFFGEDGKNVGILIQIRDAVLAWTLRTQDMLSRSTQEIDDVVRVILEQSMDNKKD